MVGTDGQAVHRFRCAGEICAVIADLTGVSRRARARPTVTCVPGFVDKERRSVRPVVVAVHNSASPGKKSGLAQLFASCRLAGLQRRCDHFQVRSRGLALAGSWQSQLAEPTLTRRGACGERSGFISLNTLQGRSQGVLVLSGCLHCQAANPDNCRCYQRCCDQTYGDLSLELFHNPPLQIL